MPPDSPMPSTESAPGDRPRAELPPSGDSGPESLETSLHPLPADDAQWADLSGTSPTVAPHADRSAHPESKATPRGSGKRSFLLKLAHVVYKAGDHAVDHDGIEHAGYLAFLGLLAIFPFLVFLVALTGLIGESTAGARFVTFLFDNLPPHLVDVLRPRVVEIISGPPQGMMTVAFLGAIWTSSSAVEGYRTVLNRAYRVATVPNYWYRRSLAILQLFLFSFLLIAGMLLLVLVPVAQEQLPVRPAGDLMQALRLLGSHTVRLGTLLLLVLMILHIHHILPNTRLRTRWLLPGAVVTGLGWMGAADVFSTYLSGVNRINLIYGSLGGIIAVLIFFYVINVIFIYGAELNYLLRQWHEERAAVKKRPPTHAA